MPLIPIIQVHGILKVFLECGTDFLVDGGSPTGMAMDPSPLTVPDGERSGSLRHRAATTGRVDGYLLC